MKFYYVQQSKSSNFPALPQKSGSWPSKKHGSRNGPRAGPGPITILLCEISGFKDASELWLSNYLKDDTEFRNDVEKLWNEMEGLYKKIHGYVRWKLQSHFGEDKMAEDEPIPAHILGKKVAYKK